MATCLILLVAGLGGVVQETLAAQAAPNKKLETRVRRLIRQLDDDQPAIRQAAEEQLQALGPEIIPLLPTATDRLSAETRRRLRRVKQTLEKEFAKQIVEPTCVHLQGRMTAVAALKAISKQTGNRLLGYEQFVADKSVELAFGKTQFWPALDAILDQVHGTVNLYGGEGDALTLQPASPADALRTAHPCYAGPFRLEITEVSLVRNLRTPNTSGMQLRLEVLWEPRLCPITVAQHLADISATDNQGRNVAVRVPDATVSAVTEPSVGGVELVLPMELPQRSAQSLASVQGQLAVLIPGRAATFEFKNLAAAANVSQRKAGVVVTFEKLIKNVDVSEVRVRIRFDDASQSLQSHLGWIYRNEAYLRGPDGKQLKQAGVQLIRKEANEVTLAYLFALDKPPQGYTFVYRTPILIVETKIPYKLKQIPLP